MAKAINSLFSEERFERIRYYLSKHDICHISALAKFDFNELLFVPGITNDLVLEAKERFDLFIADTDLATKQNRKYQTLIEDEDLNVLENSQHDSFINDENFHKPNKSDESIADVYFGIPRCGPFIRKCLVDGKIKISDISDDDFDNASCIPGLGKTTAENLRKVYKQYLSQNKIINFENDSVNNEANPSNSISVLSLSKRTENCLRRAGISKVGELIALNTDDLASIYNLGKKSYQEIQELYETGELVRDFQEIICYSENIHTDNKEIPISLLVNIGIPQKKVDTLLNCGYITIGDLCQQEVLNREYLLIQKIEQYLSISVIDHFLSKTYNLRENAKLCIEMRSNGATLQEIADKLGVSRERVRQILEKSYRSLTKSADMVAGMLLSNKSVKFSFADLKKIFDSERDAIYCQLVLQKSNYVHYLSFSDKFVRSDICPYNIDLLLNIIVEEIVGEGINYFDNLELFESELQKSNLGFLDFEDIMNYLVQNGYHFYGEFVTKGKKAYAIICHDAIKKYFTFDIKLDSKKSNNDLITLRKILEKHYQGVHIPDNNRALTGAITRNNSKMVLSGRGRYCPIEKAIYDISLLNEIYNFIQESPQTTFYYSELFSHFKGRLLAETNIINHNFLHGILKCIYPNDFIYERDLLIKNGEVRQDIDCRLNQLLRRHGKSMTKAAIKKAIPGINDFVFAFSVMRQSDIIQWDYNEYTHIDNIVITDFDRETINEILKAATDMYDGYSSDVLIYRLAEEKLIDFFSRNHIENSQNLFYILANFFTDDYRYRRPHIITKTFPVDNVTSANITRILMHCENNLNYESFFRFAEKLGWAAGTLHVVFSDLEKDYIRVSENDYVHSNHFNIPSDILGSLRSKLNSITEKAGYYAFSSIFDYEDFPACDYDWNGFLLESVITEYDIGFRIIHPQVTDRRFQRGIIVPNDCAYYSVEDLIYSVLVSDHISSISEAGLYKYLKMRGIITNMIPQELYETEKITYKNEIFSTK